MSLQYAPKQSNPIKLAGATVQAVDQLGLATSNQIEMTADEIMRSATEVSDKLRELADTIREQTRVASAQVAGFCDKATSVLEGVKELQDKLLVDVRRPEMTENEDDTSPVPAFMLKGPSEPI